MMVRSEALPSPLGGRRILITGGASGIGLATARAAVAKGASVVIVDRDRSAVERARQELPEEELLVCDQTSPEGLEGLAATLAESPVDGCFANAGFGAFGSFLEADMDSLRRHLDVNVVGTAAVAQLAARSMVTNGVGGSIVVTGSTASVFPTALFSHYSASKGAVLMLVRSLASELGPHRIRVNAVLPGITTTRMTGGVLNDGRTRQWAERETPLGRLGSPEDVAEAVVFLLSDAAGYVTGESLLIDGGQTLHGFPRWFARDCRSSESSWLPYPEFVAAAVDHEVAGAPEAGR